MRLSEMIKSAMLEFIKVNGHPDATEILEYSQFRTGDDFEVDITYAIGKDNKTFTFLGDFETLIEYMDKD